MNFLNQTIDFGMKNPEYLVFWAGCILYIIAILLRFVYEQFIE